jgi:hypothetical protein
MEAVDMATVIAHLGEDSTVTDIRARVRCRGCGRCTQDVRVVYVGATERPADFHYRR